jgi:subtilisin
VALQPFADPDEAEALARGFGGDAEERFRAVFEGFVFRGPEVAARRLAEHPRVRKVTANGVVEASADSNPTGVRHIQADQARAAGATGSGQRVVILDTGIDLDHPDLNANIEASQARTASAQAAAPTTTTATAPT